MFGYIIPSLESLKDEEKARYHEAYCGLCRTLGKRCGQRCRLALTYDLTFLALLLGSLYEPKEMRGQARCLPHPLKQQAFACSEYTEYAADVTVALAYHKGLDDWADDHSVAGRTFSFVFAAPYRAARERNPRVCTTVEEGMADIRAIEEAASAGSLSAIPTPDAAANRFGALLGELFVCRQDFWADDMRRLGAWLGKFVYVMDAAMDAEDDRASGSYNPFVDMEASPDEMRESLELIASSAAAAFEKLPLEQDVHLLRSVLYAGMWQRYNVKDKEKRHD